MQACLDVVNGFLWGKILIFLLLGTGIYFTLRLGFIQVRHFWHMFTVMKTSRQVDKAGISSFQALCTTLASRVGTGNLAGVAIALYLGGPGAIAWMWLIAFIGMATAFVESALAQLYKEVDSHGNFRGGPSYYMQRGLNARWMGILFAILLIFTYGFAFNAVQSNSIGIAFELAFSIPRWLTGLVIVALSGWVIFGGLRKIAKVAEYLVPTMSLIYLLTATAIVAMHFSELPAVIKLIIDSAFGITQAGSGFLGYAVSQAMLQGIKRGLYSNEAGMGSAPNAAASATLYPAHPASQGYVQMLGPFIDTLVICTCTAAIILLSHQLVPGSGVTGIELTQKALSEHIGASGSLFLAVAIFLFAFTTIIGNYAYAENNLFFLKLGDKKYMWPIRALVLLIVFIGSVSDLTVVWSVADLAMALMAATNIVAILALSKTVLLLAKDYHQQLKAGKPPVFHAKQYPEISAKINPGLWNS